MSMMMIMVETLDATIFVNAEADGLDNGTMQDGSRPVHGLGKNLDASFAMKTKILLTSTDRHQT